MKPQAFAAFTYLCYLYTHDKKSVPPSADEIASKLHMSKDMAAKQLTELKQRGLLDQHMVPVFKNTGKNFFSLPNELFFLHLGHGAITVYAYLLYCEDRRTHQCHPSYRTIASAVHLTVATVMKHIAKLEDRQLIAVEHTSYLDSHGMKWNGNNQYTILPIQITLDCYYQQQMDQLEEQRKWQQAQKRLGRNAEKAPCSRLWGAVCPITGQRKALPHLGNLKRIWADSKEVTRDEGKGRRKTRRSLCAVPSTTARSAGSFRLFKGRSFWRKIQGGTLCSGQALQSQGL